MVIVGDGHFRAELEQLLPDAHFTGYLYGEELARWYASADVFAFPSTTETFGNVVLEAAASGLPTVGVDRGSVKDLIIPDQTGLIAQAKNPDDFARRLESFLVNPALRWWMGRNAREFAAQFSWDAINCRLIQSYREMVFEQNDN
jgi:phosphatidylinositol alpha 1,6-mannosyltransferase